MIVSSTGTGATTWCSFRRARYSRCFSALRSSDVGRRFFIAPRCSRAGSRPPTAKFGMMLGQQSAVGGSGQALAVQAPAENQLFFSRARRGRRSSFRLRHPCSTALAFEQRVPAARGERDQLDVVHGAPSRPLRLKSLISNSVSLSTETDPGTRHPDNPDMYRHMSVSVRVRMSPDRMSDVRGMSGYVRVHVSHTLSPHFSMSCSSSNLFAARTNAFCCDVWVVSPEAVFL